MRRLLVALLALALMLPPSPVQAAGTVTMTETTHKTLQVVKMAWVSSAGGAADGTSTRYYTGEIVKLVTVPDGGGTQPTDLYDVVVNDANSVDVLAGGGANRSNASTQTVDRASLGAIVESQLVLAVTNAGNAKGGTVYVYIRP